MKEFVVEKRACAPISLNEMIKEMDLHEGDIVKIPIKSEKGVFIENKSVVVKKVYKNGHVLLDMGSWCECRTIASLYYGC